MSINNKNLTPPTKINKFTPYINSAAPIAYNMGKGVLGSFDNIRLETTCKDKWRHPPCNAGLMSKNVFVPQGTQLPLKDETVYADLPDDSMFLFSRNHSSPYCCPSTYSTDRGCVCTTPAQRSLIGITRGNNKNTPNGGY